MTTPPKTTAQRVQALRQRRDALGLVRLELYAHPDDWTQIKALAEKLQKVRDQAVVCVPSDSGA